MRKTRLIFLFVLLGIIGFSLNWAISSGERSIRENKNKIDTKIDNLNYWVGMAEKGIINFNPEVKIEPAVYTGSKIVSFLSITEDSPDVPVTEVNSTQSENSVFVDPMDPSVVLNSNNSTQNPVGSLYGANDFYSFDGSETWEGEVQGAGGSNSGDPTTSIGNNGRWYVNYISSPGGMGISYSDNQGISWTTKTIIPNPGSLADKNHMWIDNSQSSPYDGNVYVAWTNFGGSNDSQIGVSISSDDGNTWTTNNNISSAVNAQSHNQGVNISTGPNGEVYAIWAIYDGWPTDETAIGLAKSFDGGATWEPSTRIITNIRGIRTTETSKNMRVNSFPVCAVDNSNGPDKGAIYVTWSNIGTPGINAGPDIDVYIIKSIDQGNTWSEPLKVNQDPSGLGKEHYFPWVTCDASNGILSIIYYDDRNVNSSQAEAFVSNSDDGGTTWEDMKVSDVSFTPSAIPGLAGDYFGDYLGIYAQDGWVYPVWTDNRSGSAMTYCSPFQTNPLNRPKDLLGEVTFETGNCDLTWSYQLGENFLNFKIYRDGEFIAETIDTTYTDILPDYGVYNYMVTAFYTEDMESGPAVTSVQWGDAHISVYPLSLSEHLLVDSTSTKQITVINSGQLELVYNITPFVNYKKRDLDYCIASGGGDEYISNIEVGEISNSSGSENYGDYTDLSTTMDVGESYEITVTNGTPLYSSDQCGAWVDWDQNGEFDEEAIIFSGSPGIGPYTAIITPPEDALPGQTRLRIRIIYTGNLNPCGTSDYGEVEDYTINVQGWLQLEPKVGSIMPGDTSLIDVNFDSHNMDPGLYTATALFTSNDPDTNSVEVDISLMVSNMLVVVNSDKDGICIGDYATISTNLYGNVDTVTYAWNSLPEGFTSDVSEVLVMPEVSTWYFVTVSDTAGNSVQDSIYIMTYELPYIALGADTSLCNTVWNLDAGNEGSSYLWSTGEDSQTIEIDTTGHGYGTRQVSVEVTNENGCINADTIVIDFVDCTGIDEFSSNVEVNIYPNPSNGIYNIKLNSNERTEAEIIIVNNSGNVIYRIENTTIFGDTSLKIDISNNAAGIYQLIVKGENGIISKQLILNK